MFLLFLMCYFLGNIYQEMVEILTVCNVDKNIVNFCEKKLDKKILHDIIVTTHRSGAKILMEVKSCLQISLKKSIKNTKMTAQ